MIYCISDSEWADRFNAKIELDDAAVLLHSRGGGTHGRAPRNTEYEKALHTIIRRLCAQGPNTIARVLVNSEIARSVPASDRVLVSAAELSDLTTSKAVALIRKRAMKWGQKLGTKGGNSTKALRIEVPGRSRSSLRSTLKLMTWNEGPRSTADIKRLSNDQLRQVCSTHIHKAVDRLVSGEDAPNFADSTDYDVLLDDGRRLAPKKVFGLALEEALDIEAYPGHFASGWENPCFEIIDAAGYLIVEKSPVFRTPEQIVAALSSLPWSNEDRAVVEGNPTVAAHMRRERSRGLSRRKKASFRSKHGRLFCERCGLDPVQSYGTCFGDACIEIHHATVQVKDMKPGHRTKLEDLQCLCANCHRVIHREMAEQG